MSKSLPRTTSLVAGVGTAVMPNPRPGTQLFAPCPAPRGLSLPDLSLMQVHVEPWRQIQSEKSLADAADTKFYRAQIYSHPWPVATHPTNLALFHLPLSSFLPIGGDLDILVCRASCLLLAVAANPYAPACFILRLPERATHLPQHLF